LEGDEESLFVFGFGTRGVENTSPVRRESVNQPADQPFTAASHGRHAHNRLGFAVGKPLATDLIDQPIEVGRRRSVLTRELSGGDRVARVSEGDDFAIEMAWSESLRHVLGQ
jgi:hypothetical protein